MVDRCRKSRQAVDGGTDEPYTSVIPGIGFASRRAAPVDFFHPHLSPTRSRAADIFPAIPSGAGKKAGICFDMSFTMTPRPMPSDIDSEWLDEMMTKMQRELQRQLDRVAKAHDTGSDAGERAADARTLTSLERTLERLTRLERERATVKEKKIAKHDGSARAALERRLDKRLAAARTDGGSGKPER
jgi:hypothetical protein